MEPVLPLNCGSPSALAPQPRDWDVLLTAETHNFPCAVAPYPGVQHMVRMSHLHAMPASALAPCSAMEPSFDSPCRCASAQAASLSQ